MFVDESKHLFIYFFFSKKRYRRQRRQEKGFFVVFRVLPFQKNIAAKRARVQNTNYDSEYRSTNGRMHKEFSIKILVYIYIYIYISKKKAFRDDTRRHDNNPGGHNSACMYNIHIYIFFVFGWNENHDSMNNNINVKKAKREKKSRNRELVPAHIRCLRYCFCTTVKKATYRRNSPAHLDRVQGKRERKTER